MNSIQFKILRSKLRRKVSQALGFGPGDLAITHPKAFALIQKIRSERLTHLTEAKLARLATACSETEKKGVAGTFIEAGCALGGSTILIASQKSSNRRLFVFDVFEMIPPPTDQDTPDVHLRYKEISEGKSKGINGDIYYGYQTNLYEKVKSNLEAHGYKPEDQSIQLIKGLLEETMSIDEPVAFAHIDVDWYSPVKASLERIFPNLSIGGSIILDDYYDWGGCKKATDEFLIAVKKGFVLDDFGGSLRITKIK